ncbi:hypothetical protein ACEPAI_9393 [Sanghuangporus weigelae]
MHFSPPKLHLSKSNASLSSQHSAGRSSRGEDHPVQATEPSIERETTKEEEEEEEVSEWIEGQDVVIERKSCVPGEDVQVEVLRGAAANLNGRDHHHLLAGGNEEVKKAKERLRKRGKEEEEREVGGVFGRCMEALQHHGHGHAHPHPSGAGAGTGADGQRD